MLDALQTGKLEKCYMMPLLYWNKEDVSISFAADMLDLKNECSG